jgi:hypothetical protein
MPHLVDQLDQVAACLSAAASTTDAGAKVIYTATARARLDAVAERTKELRWLLEVAEGALVHAPAQTVMKTVVNDAG